MRTRIYLSYSEVTAVASVINLIHLIVSVIFAHAGYFIFALLSQILLAVYLYDALRVECTERKENKIKRQQRKRRP